MENYLTRLCVSVAKEIQSSIFEGIPWENEVFAEMLRHCENNGDDRRATRSAVYSVLDMIPGTVDKAKVWEELSATYLPPKHYSSPKVNLSKMSDADIKAHFSKILAAKQRVLEARASAV